MEGRELAWELAAESAVLGSLSDGFTRSRPLPATLPLQDFEFFSPSPRGGALPVRRICTEGCPHDRFWPGKVFECPQERILPCERDGGTSAFNTPSWLAAGGSLGGGNAAPGVLTADATPGAGTKSATSKCLLDA